jgi:hypothetical protein
MLGVDTTTRRLEVPSSKSPTQRAELDLSFPALAICESCLVGILDF